MKCQRYSLLEFLAVMVVLMTMMSLIMGLLRDAIHHTDDAVESARTTQEVNLLRLEWRRFVHHEAGTPKLIGNALACGDSRFTPTANGVSIRLPRGTRHLALRGADCTVSIESDDGSELAVLTVARPAKRNRPPQMIRIVAVQPTGGAE
jgi:hypothetical protein